MNDNSDSKSFSEKLDQLLRLVKDLQSQRGMQEVWLDNEDVMRLLHVCSRTLQRYRDQGLIAYSKFGGKFYYGASDIENHLKKGRIAPFDEM